MNIIIYTFVLIFGLIIGSFLNCLIWRFYKEEKMSGRSYCPKCKKQIAWYDNIPVLSYLILKGRCRKCKKGILWQYPIVELITGILFVLSWSLKANSGFIVDYHFILSVFRDWFLISVMIVIFVIDLRWYLILDSVSLPAALIVLIVNLLLGFNWLNLLVSGIIGGSFFLIQFVVSRGKWIGGGDIRLGLLMGLALGWPYVLVAIIMAYFIGSFIGVGLIIGGKKEWGSKVPMGTFLTVATLATMFYGEIILNWYLNIFP